jgi:hypothetical protein
LYQEAERLLMMISLARARSTLELTAMRWVADVFRNSRHTYCPVEFPGYVDHDIPEGCRFTHELKQGKLKRNTIELSLQLMSCHPACIPGDFMTQDKEREDGKQRTLIKEARRLQQEVELLKRRLDSPDEAEAFTGDGKSRQVV